MAWTFFDRACRRPINPTLSPLRGQRKPFAPRIHGVCLKNLIGFVRVELPQAQHQRQGRRLARRAKNSAVDCSVPSKAGRSRRVVELSEYRCAVVFSKDNVVRDSVWSPSFTRRLCVRKGDKLPFKYSAKGATSNPDEWHELDAYWWLTERPGADALPESVYDQHIVKENEFNVTMVIYEAE